MSEQWRLKKVEAQGLSPERSRYLAAVEKAKTAIAKAEGRDV